MPIVVNKDPFILLVFTRHTKQRDHILSLLPIEPQNRSGLVISSDFIEFANVPKPKEWYEKVFGDEIEPRGRKGRGSSNRHVIVERYPSPDDREKDLEKDGKGWVFRDFTEVTVALKDVTIDVRIYPNGRYTVNTKGQDRKLLAPYIAEAMKILKDAEMRYHSLKSSAK